MSRNPAWGRDELILALELYTRVNPIHTSEKHPEIIKLSEILNKLAFYSRRLENYRNPNGVYMKLCNFLRLDHSYSGEGLKAGAKLDKIIWDEYYNDHKKLKDVATAIINANQVILRIDNEQDEHESEFVEGKLLTRVHTMRERNPSLVNKKKNMEIKRKGKLICEVCGFDFSKTYGDIGKDFIECHHIKPVSEFDGEYKIKISDLALVCANCHRMLHKTRPWLSIADLKEAIKNHQY